MDFPMYFIRRTEEYGTLEKNVPAPYFRKSFEINRKLKKASLLISGLGFYEAHINGKDITKGYLAPYRSNHDHYIYFDRYDITENLLEGKNVLACILGNGMQNSVVETWDFNKMIWRGAPQFSFSIELEYEEGENEVIVSDNTVKTADSPIIFNDLHYGEYYDARLEIPDWDMPDFDDSGWDFAQKAPTTRGEPKLCEADPIVCRYEIKPVSIKEYDGGYVYDFGENNAGLCRLKINGEEGQKLLLQYFEVYNEGKPYPYNIRFSYDVRFQEDEYTCSGKGTEIHIPRFTYHGFQYVYIKGITKEQATEDLLTYLVISSDIKENGHFECSDEIINKIQDATVRSDFSNFHYFPTDCPHREKNGWTADAALSAEQMLLNITPVKSYKEWMNNIYKSLKDSGMMPGIIPTPEWGYGWGNGPAWDCVLVYIPYFTYIYRGDDSMFDGLKTPLMRYLTYLYSRLDKNNLMEIGLGDWCQAGVKGEAENLRATPLIVTDSILTVDIAEKAAFIYDVLGCEEQKIYAQSLADKVRKAIRENLMDTDKVLMNCDAQSGQAMAIYYNIFTPEEKEKAVENLVNIIHSDNDLMNVGVLGGKVIFRVLADNGYCDLAYNMITTPKHPSYANHINRGYNTLCEYFAVDGEVKDSYNHHFWGDVSAWFYTYLAGIRINPTRRNVNQVTIAPEFIEALDFVKANHNLPAGRLAVDWIRNGEEITLTVTKPERVEISFVAPNGYFAETKICTDCEIVYLVKKN